MKSPIVTAYELLGGSALIAIRESWPGDQLASGEIREASQVDFRFVIAKALDLAPKSRSHLANMEAGRKNVTFGLVVALAEALGLNVEEVLSRALHLMLHGDKASHRDAAMVIQANRAKGHAQLVADSVRSERMAELMAGIAFLDEASPQEPRTASTADHPPIDK